jgi:hypothetical protein
LTAGTADTRFHVEVLLDSKQAARAVLEIRARLQVRGARMAAAP